MFKKLVNFGHSKLALLDEHTLEVVKKSSTTTIVRGAGMLFGVAISIFVGRLLGADGLGIINLSNQIVNILLMVTMLGFPTVILKEVAIAYSRKDWYHAQSVIKTSFKVNGTFALITISIALLLIPYLVAKVFDEPQLKIPLTIAVVAMLFQVASRIYASAVNGYKKIWQSALVNQSLSVFIVLISVVIQYLLDYKITVVSVAWSYGISRAIVALSIGAYWKRIHHPATKTSFIPRQLFKVALPLLFVQATNTIASSIDTLMIGTFLDAKAVGLYSVTLRIAFVSSFFLQVTNAALGPKVASMFANNQLDDLQTTIQKVTKGLTLISIAIFLVIVFAGKILLNIWGTEFSTAYWPLIILSIGQMVNISAGCVGLVLTLCNQEKIWGYVTLSSAILNTILNVLFIKWWGINGAALATALNLIFINVAAVILVRKRIKINPIPFLKI